MSENRDTAIDQAQPERQSDDGGDQGIEITSGEPNTFEPEEDPEAAADES